MGESYGKWLYIGDTTSLQCKRMLKNWSRSVKNAKGEGMKYTPAIKVHSNVALYPFHSWRLDFIGHINPSSKGCRWILVATELFTKWVEAMAMKKAIGSSVANFLRENIICHFGVTSKIISDNGTTFLNKDVRCLTKWYSISHMTLTPYYPNILGKMTKENGKEWKEELPTSL